MKKIIVTVLLIFLIVLIIFFAIGKTEIKFNQDENTANSYYQSDFYKIYNSDKLIVVDLWASWCKPCIESLPELDSLSKQFEDKDVQFFTLSTEKDTLKCKKIISKNEFLKSHDITLSHFANRDSIYSNIDFIDYYVKSSLFKVSSEQIPYIAVIKNKKVLYRSSDNEVNMEKLSKVIEDNSNQGQH